MPKAITTPQTEDKQFTIDVDIPIKKWNDANPDKKPMNRKQLAKDLKNNPQLFSDWKGGKVPKSIIIVFEICQRTGCTLAEFMSEIKK